MQLGFAGSASHRTYVVMGEPSVRAIELNQLPASNARGPAEAVIRPDDRPALLREMEDRLRPIEGKGNELGAMRHRLPVTRSVQLTRLATHGDTSGGITGAGLRRTRKRTRLHVHASRLVLVPSLSTPFLLPLLYGWASPVPARAPRNQFQTDA
jgi:hypothetical protein